MISLGWDEAKRLPFIKEGALVQCRNCKGKHRAVESRDNDGCPTGLFYISCAYKTFIVGMLGRRLPAGRPSAKKENHAT
jgi:hypothetical protein